MEQVKKTLLFSKMLSIICAIAILLSVINLPSLVFAVEEEPQGYDASGLTVENMPQELAALAGLTAQSGSARTYGLTPQNVLPEKDLSIFDASDLNKITVVNSNGEKTSYVFANDVKYIDGNSIYFINNDFVASNKFVHGTWVAYENASSDKKVYMARRASNGVIYIDGDTVIRVKPNAVHNNLAQLNTVVDNGSQRTAVEYADVFGSGTVLQYLAVYGGMKENLYLEQYNGINSFCYTLEIPNMTAALMNQGRQVGIYNAEGELIYVFGQPFAEDSYTENGVKQPHYTDNCGYHLAQLGNGVYTLTMWVDPEFLADENTTYPVVIDPPMQVSKGSIEDATVTSSGSDTTSAFLTVGFNGSNESAIYIKNNFLWYFRHLNTSDISSVEYVTKTADAGLTVNVYDSNSIMDMDTVTLAQLTQAQDDQCLTTVLLNPGDNFTAFDITDLAVKWLNYYLNEGNRKNPEYGFILRATSGLVNSARIYSAENTGSAYPYFTISYDEQQDCVENGVYLIKNEQYGSYLTHNVIDDGANVNVLPYRNYNVQMWKIQQYGVSDYGEIFYTISPYDNLDYCLSSANPQNLYENDVNVDLSFKSANPSQANGMLWRIVKNGDGSFRIMPAYSTMQALTADNSGDYNSYLYEYYGWTSMRWNLVSSTALDGCFSFLMSVPEMPEIVKGNFEKIEEEFNIWPAEEGTLFASVDMLTRIAGITAIASEYAALKDSLIIPFNDVFLMYSHYLNTFSGLDCNQVCGNNGCKNLCRTYNVKFLDMINGCESAKAQRNKDLNSILRAAESFVEDIYIGESVTFAQTTKHSTSGSVTYDSGNLLDISHYLDNIDEITDLNTFRWWLMINKYNTTSRCVVQNLGGNVMEAEIVYYLYDVFDWDRDSNAMFGLISQRQIWEMQYGGIAKGFLVRGAARYIVRWTKGAILTPDDDSIIIYEEEAIL